MPLRIASIESYDWTQILRESKAEGHNLVNRLLTDFRSGTNRFDALGEKLLVCLIGNSVVASAGLNREPDKSFARAGRIRRLYVVPKYRGQGYGRNLVEEIVALAQPHFNLLTVNVGKLDAYGFYEHLGFTRIEKTNVTHKKVLNTKAVRI